MPNYKKMYLSLFNDVTDAIEYLKQAQSKAEEIFMDGNNPEITTLPILPESETATK